MFAALIIILAIVAAFAAYAAQRPEDFRVIRTITIAAPPSAIFPYLSNLRKGQMWSPWVELEPEAEYTFEGPEEGVGATLKWQGRKTGAGILSIDGIEQEAGVRMRLEFLRPMKAVNVAEYTLESDGAQTLVSWSMHGKNSFAAKAMSVFMDCESMTGKYFEKGLRNLKALIEQA
jgi:Polyketide cyclase / dehydrase and lipid transport